MSGCSFTDYNFESLHKEYDCSFPKWPEIVAEKLGVECVNRGACGAGNNYIYSTLLDEVIRTPKEEILCVIPAWSQVQREDFETYSKYTPYNKTSHKDKFYDNMIWQNKRVNREGNIFYWMIDQLRRYISFETMCKAYGVPYVQFQMISLWRAYVHFKIDELGKDRQYWETEMKECLAATGYNELMNTNFLGWPGCVINNTYWNQKSWTLSNCLKRQDKISDEDVHPNKQGHEKLAEEFLKHLHENKIL